MSSILSSNTSSIQYKCKNTENDFNILNRDTKKNQLNIDAAYNSQTKIENIKSPICYDCDVFPGKPSLNLP